MQFDLLIKCVNDHRLWDEIGVGILVIALLVAAAILATLAARWLTTKHSEGYRLDWVKVENVPSENRACTPTWVWFLLLAAFVMAVYITWTL